MSSPGPTTPAWPPRAGVSLAVAQRQRSSTLHVVGHTASAVPRMLRTTPETRGPWSIAPGRPQPLATDDWTGADINQAEPPRLSLQGENLSEGQSSSPDPCKGEMTGAETAVRAAGGHSQP